MKRIISVLTILTVSLLEAYNPYQITRLKNQKAPYLASGFDFRGAGSLLKGISFSKAQLSGAAFNTPVLHKNKSKALRSPFLITIIGQKTDLTGANFSKAELVSTNFAGAILRNANFNGANLKYTNFAGANLTGATFKGAQNIAKAIFCGAIMPDGSQCSGASWKNSSGDVFQCGCAS